VAARQVVCAICKFCALKLAGLYVLWSGWVVGGSKAGCVCDMQVLCNKTGWFACVVEWVGGRWQQGRLCVRYANSVQ